MKTPVVIALRKASFVLRQFGKRAAVVEKVDADCAVGIARGGKGPFVQFQIMARVSAARFTCGWDRDAILFRSCFLVVSSLPFDSSSILLTRNETSMDRISGKLYQKIEYLLVSQGGHLQIGETGKHLLYDIAVF